MDLEVLRPIVERIPDAALDTFFPVENRYFSCFSAQSGNEFIPRNNDLVKGKVNLNDNLHIPIEDCSTVEMMHAGGNVSDDLACHLFGGDRARCDKNEVNTVLNTYISQNFPRTPIVDFFGVSDNVLQNVGKRLDIMKKFRDGETKDPFIDIAENVITTKGKFVSVTTHDKIVFMASVMPYLFIDSIETEPRVWAIVTFYGSFISLYTFRGHPEEADYFQSIMHVSKCVLQSYVRPTLASASFHILDHCGKSYRQTGSLCDNSAFPCEGKFYKFRVDSTGGNQRIKTVFTRKTYTTAGKFVGYGCKVVEMIISAVELLDSYGFIFPLPANQVDYVVLLKRAVLNFLSDEVFFSDDNHVFLTFTDLELSQNGVKGWLAGDYAFKDSIEYGGEFWITSDEDVEAFWEELSLERIPRFSHWKVSVASSFTYHKEFTSLQCDFQGMKETDFKKRAFAYTYSSNHRVHLFCIYCYYIWGNSQNNNYYINALVSPIPINPLISLIKSPQLFTIDLNVLHSIERRYMLVSFHRLHFDDLFFYPITDNTLYGCIHKLNYNQFQVLPSITFSKSNSVSLLYYCLLKENILWCWFIV